MRCKENYFIFAARYKSNEVLCGVAACEGGVQITCTMSEPAIGTPHWKDTHYQNRHLPLTEQFDGGLHQGNIDTVFYVLQLGSL